MKTPIMLYEETLNSNASSVSDQMGKAYIKLSGFMLKKIMIVETRVMLRQRNVSRYMSENEKKRMRMRTIQIMRMT